MTPRYWCLSTLISVLILSSIMSKPGLPSTAWHLINSKEIFRRPRAQSFHLPAATEHINCSKLLGVLFQSTSKWIPMSSTLHTFSVCSAHVSDKLLQHKGMPQHQLSVVTSRIYLMLSQHGERFPQCWTDNRIKAFFRRVKRFGYIDTVLTVDDLLSQSWFVC